MKAAFAWDEQRRLYHMVGGYSVYGSPTLFTFDLNTGEVLADPTIPNNRYFSLAVSSSQAPLRGRVTPFVNNLLGPGVTRNLAFEASGHGGELYVPFISCTPGTFPVPGSSLVMPLAWDACSDLYFLSPASSTFFSLTATGSPVGLLPPGGVTQGTVTLPSFAPAGLSLDLYIGFLTITPTLQWSGVHGMAILHLSF